MQTPHNAHGSESSLADPAQNPYQARQAQPAPALDANAPHLNSADVQRLNRKALLFLAGIVVLLLASAFWLFGGAFSGAGERGTTVRKGEQVVIPAAPRDLPELPPERPRPEDLAGLPPLPVYEDVPQPRPPTVSLSGAGLPDRRSLSLQERRMHDVAAIFDGDGAPGNIPGMLPPDEYAKLMMAAGNPPPASATPQGPAGAASATPMYKPDTLLLRGTYIRCILQSRVISDVPGYTSCVVTEPVYSVNGRRLLLPRGAKVSGTYENDAVLGDRVAVIWDRITTPTGLDVNMQSPGVDMLGAAGHPGQYTAHWGQRIGSALLISMLSDAFKYAAARHGPQETAIASGVVVQSPYESSTARTMERMANMALERSMARPPTVTIHQGAIINIYVARDVDFSAVLR